MFGWLGLGEANWVPSPLPALIMKPMICDRVYGQEFCQILRYGFLQFEQYVFAFIEERRCQIMIGLWQYGISEMGFGMPRLKCHVSFEFLYAQHKSFCMMKHRGCWFSWVREFRFSLSLQPKHRAKRRVGSLVFWYGPSSSFFGCFGWRASYYEVD